MADDITDAIPADANAVVTFGDLGKMDSDLKAFTQAAGIPLPAEVDFSVFLNAFQGTVDAARGAAVVLLLPQPDSVAMVVPVQDAEAAIKKLGGQQQGEVYQVQLAIAPMPLVVLPKERLLILAPNPQTLMSFKSVAKSLENVLTAEQKKLRQASNAFVYVNLGKLRPMIELGLNQAQMGLDQLGQLPAGAFGAGGDPEMIVRMLRGMLDVVRSIAFQSASLHVGLSLNGQRARAQAALVFDEGGSIRKALADRKPPAKDLLVGLPAMPFYMAFGGDMSGFGPMIQAATEKLMNAFMAKLDAKDRQETMAAMDQFWKAVTGFNMVFDFGESGAFGVATYFTSNPKGVQKFSRDMTKASQKMMGAFLPGAEKLEIKISSRKIDGLEVDEYVMDFKGLPDEMQKIFSAMYGEQFRWQMAPVEHGLGYAMGAKGEPITLLTKKGARLADDAQVRATLRDLPDRPYFVFLVDPFGALRAATRMTAQFGVPAPPFQLPAQSPPPFGLALLADDESASVSIVVRAQTIQELTKLAP
jgi:hypothetical protein